MNAMIEIGKTHLANQPFSVMMGTELLDISADGVTLRLRLVENHLQQEGFVHGGVVGYLADNALAFAGGAAYGGRPVVTSEYKINFTRPARGETLIARAVVVARGQSQAVVRCEVLACRDGEEKVCAVAQGTVALMAGPAVSG